MASAKVLVKARVRKGATAQCCDLWMSDFRPKTTNNRIEMANSAMFASDPKIPPRHAPSDKISCDDE